MIRITTAALIGTLAGIALSLAAFRYLALPLTVAEARYLPARELAIRLLGPYVGSRVIEVERHEDLGSSGPHNIPSSVVFYTQPMLTWPRLNGICGTDVITVQFNWFEHDHAAPLTLLKFNHIEARRRFKAFPMPPGEPGSPENDRLQAAACAKFRTALDSFAAPDAGDAQWLAAMEREYSLPFDGQPPFVFACDDFADPTCAKALGVLPHLALRTAQLVESVDCPPMKTWARVHYCYRLTFPYKGTDDPEWRLTLLGAWNDGSSSAQIRSASLAHVRPPFVLR